MNLKNSTTLVISTLTICGIVSLSSVPGASAYTDTNITSVTSNYEVNSNQADDDIVITPRDMDVSRGSYSGTQFLTEHSLKKSNGANVNFWINNKGASTVVITINGKEERPIAPGKNGHISLPAGFFSKTFKFRAVPASNGGTINIDYEIAQRHN